MTIQSWEQVKELLHQVMQLDPKQRAPFLDKACSSDVALRAEVAIRSRTLGPDHTRTLISKINLSDELYKEGHIHEAEKLQREALATQIRVRGSENVDSLIFKTYLARTLTEERHYSEAEKLARETYEVQRHSLGPQHPDTLDTLRQLGKALAYSHRYSEASRLFRNAIEKGSKSGAQGNPVSVWYSFACVAAAANQPDDALQYLHEAVNRGYKDVDGLMSDDDLKNLHPNPKFQQFVATLKHPPAKVQTQ
jgi:tetratricopeptide (TPR) repeat protein